MRPYSLIHATLLSAIGSAEISVYLTNAYFIPDPQLLKEYRRQQTDTPLATSYV
jgi:phosphatidylserine/phosphatidylglycerophosphate/cardiolipin synthase-like enzyme